MEVDFLNVIYERKLWGLRKRLKKRPFPDNPSAKHPNIITIGSPLATVIYWQLLPQSSLMIKDEDYRPEVTDDAYMDVIAPEPSLKDRPYWRVPKHPSLYQLSNVAFAHRWVKNKSDEYTEEELMEMELGEAEGSPWWFLHGPGRTKKKGK